MLNSIENFTMIQKIGEGSFSEVLKVVNIKTGQIFAAKRLIRQLNLNELRNFIELRVLRKLDHHPNVLGLIDFIYEQEAGILTLLFNLMDKSLFDLIKDRRRRLSETRCKNLLYQMVNGLNFLHNNGIFHRDVKPENILIKVECNNSFVNPTRRELLQIGDLGSAGYTSSPQPYTGYVGTRWYRAPECLLTDGFYGPKMDIWATGCCFYEILTLDPLFPGENDIDQLHKIHDVIGTPSNETLQKFNGLTMDVEFPKKSRIDFYMLVPRLSHHGVDVMKKMLVYHPTSRISARKLLQHAYFDDMKALEARDSIAARITFENINDNDDKRDFIRLKQRAQSEYRQIKKIEMELTKRIEKQLERGWNMPDCDKKKTFVRAMTFAGKNAKKINFT